MIAALAARAALVVGGIAALLVLVRRRARLVPVPTAIAVVARTPLGPGLGVALVETEGRRLLVGWGKDGVTLMHDLGTRGVAP